MLRLRQIVQNALIRLLVIFSVLFQSLFGFVKNIFVSLGKSVGFSDSNSGYFIESEQKQVIEESTNKAKTSVETVKTPESPINNRRRPKSNMDDFMKMAKELNKG